MQMIRIFAAIVFFEMVSLSLSSCRENMDERKLEQKPTEQFSVGEIIISHRKRAQWSAFEHEVWPHWHQPNHYCVASGRTVHNAPMWSWMLDGISQCLSSVFSFALRIFHSVFYALLTHKPNAFVSFNGWNRIRRTFWQQYFRMLSIRSLRMILNVSFGRGCYSKMKENAEFLSRRNFHGNIFASNDARMRMTQWNVFNLSATI